MITFKELGNYGRTANQLFQIAATIGLALDNNDQYIFPPWKYESFFNLHGCFNNNIVTSNEYQEPHFHYQPITYKPNMNLKGYFQSIRYWEKHQDKIRDFLTPAMSQEKLVKAIQADPGYCTAIHVRRTDYLKFADCHTVLGMDYYNKAMELAPGEKFCVFSDDIEWCRQNFKGKDIQFMPNDNEIFDLAAMSKFKNNIVANSSFSWWSAWLNANSNKRVIAPNKWFGPTLAPTHSTKDLIPSTWIQI